MLIFDSISDISGFLSQIKAQNKSVGFVPTMGALHQGHLSLIAAAKAETDITVCSIYVNPTQFNNASDFAKYPKTLDNDKLLLKQAGCHVLFLPTDSVMYPSGTQHLQTQIQFGHITQVLEGAFRPGHFNGVGIVVSKLFNIVRPDRAYFGQKDLQQCLVIKQLIEDLAFPVVFVQCPTARETDGLAMSSRNLRLTPTERTVAPLLYQALLAVERAVLNGLSVHEATEAGQAVLAQEPAFTLEYLAVVHTTDLQPAQDTQQRPLAVCVAAFLGQVRLIDNLLIH